MAPVDVNTWPSWAGFPMRALTGIGFRAWIIGELYPIGETSATDASVAAVVRGGDAGQLNGHFALLAQVADTPSKWHIWTSRFGSVHLYLSRGRKGTALSTSLRDAVSEAGQDSIDTPAIRSFLRYGFFLGNSTFQKNTQVLRPAQHYELDGSGSLVEHSRYWQWEEAEQQDLGLSRAIDSFGERLAGVVLDHVSDCPTAIPVSGGLDSRSTIAALIGGSNNRG